LKHLELAMPVGVPSSGVRDRRFNLSGSGVEKFRLFRLHDLRTSVYN
jgi:hypothetical protein